MSTNGRKDTGIRKFEFVKKSQFLSNCCNHISSFGNSSVDLCSAQDRYKYNCLDSQNKIDISIIA